MGAGQKDTSHPSTLISTNDWIRDWWSLQKNPKSQMVKEWRKHWLSPWEHHRQQPLTSTRLSGQHAQHSYQHSLQLFLPPRGEAYFLALSVGRLSDPASNRAEKVRNSNFTEKWWTLPSTDDQGNRSCWDAMTKAHQHWGGPSGNQTVVWPWENIRQTQIMRRLQNTYPVPRRCQRKDGDCQRLRRPNHLMWCSVLEQNEKSQ